MRSEAPGPMVTLSRAVALPWCTGRPTGRGAGLVAGPDVWEVVRAVKSARAMEPDLDEEEILLLATTNSGLSLRPVRIAVRYWASHTAEIDAEIAAADAAETAAEEAWLRERQLLARDR